MLRGLIIAAGIAVSSLSAAADFTAADALFKNRKTVEGVMEARAAYAALVDQTDGAEKIYAVSQINRLDYVRGEILLSKDAKDERKDIFDACLENNAQISPDAIGSKTEAYYHFEIMCLAFWAESSSALARVGRLGRVKDTIKAGLEFTTNATGEFVGTFEGGGIARYAASVYGNPGARPVGLYKPELALSLSAAAMVADYAEDRAYPEPLSGAEYYENNYIRATILDVTGSTAEAISFLEESIDELDLLIEDESLPEGREIETRHQRTRLQIILDEYQAR